MRPSIDVMTTQRNLETSGTAKFVLVQNGTGYLASVTIVQHYYRDGDYSVEVTRGDAVGYSTLLFRYAGQPESIMLAVGQAYGAMLADLNPPPEQRSQAMRARVEQQRKLTAVDDLIGALERFREELAG